MAGHFQHPLSNAIDSPHLLRVDHLLARAVPSPNHNAEAQRHCCGGTVPRRALTRAAPERAVRRLSAVTAPAPPFISNNHDPSFAQDIDIANGLRAIAVTWGPWDGTGETDGLDTVATNLYWFSRGT